MVPFAANVWTTSLSLARPICAKSYVPMPATIMERELTDRWTKTRPSIAQLSALASCGHVLFLADFITSTFGSSFQYTQLSSNLLSPQAPLYSPKLLLLPI